jgi:hypothetical protein
MGQAARERGDSYPVVTNLSGCDTIRINQDIHFLYFPRRISNI